MRTRVRLILAATLAIMLSACATHIETVPTPSNPASDGVANAATTPSANPPPAAKTCPAGAGAVVRVVPINAAGRNANADLMNGGVVGGVLGGPGSTDKAQGGASGGSANGGVAHFDIYVLLDQGERIILNQRDATGIVTGSRVTVEGCRARLIR